MIDNVEDAVMDCDWLAEPDGDSDEVTDGDSLDVTVPLAESDCVTERVEACDCVCVPEIEPVCVGERDCVSEDEVDWLGVEVPLPDAETLRLSLCELELEWLAVLLEDGV